MSLFDIIDLMDSQNGDELFDKIRKLLEKIGIRMYDERGVEKSLYALCYEVVEFINKNNTGEDDGSTDL